MKYLYYLIEMKQKLNKAVMHFWSILDITCSKLAEKWDFWILQIMKNFFKADEKN